MRKLTLILWLWLPCAALADGRIFVPHAIPAAAEIPDQRALLSFHDGVEELAIETSFTGQGTNFAWVVPLPSVPQIDVATPGLFPTLDYLTRPDLIYREYSLYLFFIFWTLVPIIYFRLHQRGKLTGRQIRINLLYLFFFSAFYLPMGGLPAVLLTAGMAIGLIWWGTTKSNPAKLVSGLLVAFTSLPMFCCCLPARAVTRGNPQVEGSTQVLQRGQVGPYETVVLADHNAQRLVDWLAENGYALPPGVEPVVAKHVKDGWVFAAAKLQNAGDEAQSRLTPPLVFTFRTDTPVYPLRLTGTGGRSLAVDLFVSGPGRARAPHFQTAYCGEVLSDEAEGTEVLASGHEGLQKFTQPGDVFTRLQANLTPEQMKVDALIKWEPFAAHRPTLYSPLTATIWAANLGTGVLSLGVCVLCLIATVGRLPRHRWKPALGALATLALASGLAFRLSADTTEIQSARAWFQAVHSLGHHVSDAWEDGNGRDSNKTLAWAKAWAADYCRKQQFINRLTMSPLRHEDSPGNYWMELDDKNRLLVYEIDKTGAKQLETR
jgi:hypothetical protein